MRLKALIFLLILLQFNLSCSKKEVDTSEIDNMIRVTDSLLQELSSFQNQLLDSVYRISGNNLININPKGKIKAKDSLEFYLLLQDVSQKLKDIFQYSQKEILFTHYQLESIKEDIINEGKETLLNKDDIKLEANVMELLEQRVDSSILLMNESINQIYEFLGDTLSLDLIGDTIK